MQWKIVLDINYNNDEFMKKYLFSILFISAFLLTATFFVPNAKAQLSAGVTNLGTAVTGSGLENTKLDTAVGLAIKTILGLAGSIFLILTVYAGVLWMTAQGDEGKVGTAKGIITAAVIGLVITMSAYAITVFVTGKLGSTPTGSGTGSGQIQGAITNNQCTNGGGKCVGPTTDLPDGAVYDPSSPCNPTGTGEVDPYEGTTLGTCVDGSVCCLLK